ncbi:hypothetical protein DI487_15905 [Flavobacterium sediminis]|uniref:Uncharacterized protein n=1 Tax=Flavobacterium sediminis TaxID=2201181 RepID=A0A2U8QZE1_9FLAO|nr:hypothetical protein DI487_15905 [Flavobacterium sediminis]
MSYYYNENDIEAALKIEDKIIELEYKPEHLASRAMLYESLENRSKAYDDYNRIIELTECDLEYFIKILQYEFENKMYEKVIENSHKLIACDKKNESIVLDGLYTSLFFCNDIANGNFFLNKKLELNPDNFNPYYIKAIILLKDEQYERALNYLDLALKAKDINKENITSVNLLKLGCYLLKEDYDRFVDCWKIANIKSLNDNLNFIFLENYNAEKVKINLEFNRNEGIINSTIIVPTKVFILLKEKYGLIIN